MFSGRRRFMSNPRRRCTKLHTQSTPISKNLCVQEADDDAPKPKPLRLDERIVIYIECEAACAQQQHEINSGNSVSAGDRLKDKTAREIHQSCHFQIVREIMTANKMILKMMVRLHRIPLSCRLHHAMGSLIPVHWHASSGALEYRPSR